MEGQKDANGFELQTTMAPSAQKTADPGKERRQSIPTEPPKVPENRNSVQGPPKPSKSSSLPKNGQSSVENGHGTKSKAEEAEQSGIGVNMGYFKSWRALLKVVKMLCFIAMIVSVCIPMAGISKVPKTPRYNAIWQRMPPLEYGLAAATIGIIIEIAMFIIYLLGLNSFLGSSFSFLPFVLTGCHLLALALVFAVPLVFNAKAVVGAAITAYVAFDLVTIAAYTMELYFNMVWLQGGPELACLPFF